MRPTRLLRWVVAVVVVMVSGGCGSVADRLFDADGVPSVSPERVAQMNRELAGLPSLEATVVEFRRLTEDVARRIEAIVPEARFVIDPSNQQSDSEVACPGEWSRSDGKAVQLEYWISDVPIPESAWPQVLAVVRDAAAAHGITEQNTLRDKPAESDHDVEFTGRLGGRVTIGSWKAAVLQVRTPCRLPAGPRPTVPQG